MSDSYTKLFSSITESTIWSEPAGTRLVWITMLAKCNRKGEFYSSVPGLARLANVTMDECKTALETLMAPDEWSRTPDHDGRRIIEIDGGWLVVSYSAHQQRGVFRGVRDRLQGFAWTSIRERVFNRDRFTCQYCGKRGGDLECDHVFPFSRGGSDDLENLKTACKACNRSKRDLTIQEWIGSGSAPEGIDCV